MVHHRGAPKVLHLRKEPAAMEEAGAVAVRRRAPRRCPPCRHSPRPSPAVPHMATPADDDDHDAVNVAVGGKLATVEPTMDGLPSLQSEPFITTATASSFQICRGRKPTLIIEATRGETSSPDINKFNSIPLRCWPVSDLNRNGSSQSRHQTFSSKAPSHHPIFQIHLSSFFRHQQAPHQQINVVHHVHVIDPVPKLSGPHPTDVGDRLACIAHLACGLGSNDPGRPSQCPSPLPSFKLATATRKIAATARRNARTCCPDAISPSACTTSIHRSPELAAHMHAPCSYRLQHVVNVGSVVDDRRFTLKATAKVTVPAATLLNQIFYK
ncbi:hypothetical protein ACLOJK_037158 [Asimina triloba]